MQQFLNEAGTVILLMIVSSAMTLGYAISFAYRPTDKKRKVTHAFMRTTLYAGMFGFLIGFMMTLRATLIASKGQYAPWWQILIEGFMESLNNLVLAFAIVALCALFVAVGEARNKAA